MFNVWYGVAFFALVPAYFMLAGVRMFLGTGKPALLFHGTLAMMIKRVGYIFGATFGRGMGRKMD